MNGGKVIKGLLITFEGQDGSGKSTLLPLIATKINQKGFSTILVPEFSSNILGKFLLDVLSHNKFLRFNDRGPSALTETMYVIADLYSQDEMEIRPKLDQGFVVIKERHIDSILACQIPKIVDDYLDSDTEKLFNWLIRACANLTEPDLTFFLRVQEAILKDRIVMRGEQVAESDFLVFKKRQSIYDRLAYENQHRWIDLSNDGSPVEAVQFILNKIEHFLNKS